MSKQLFKGITIVFILLMSSYLCAEDIAIVKTSSNQVYETSIEGFKNKLADLGYSEGNNLKILSYDLKEEGEDKVLSEVKASAPDLVLAVGTAAAKTMSDGLAEIPVVFVMVLDPSQINGENVTGVIMEISGRAQLAEIKNIVPFVSKVGLIHSSSASGGLINDARTAAPELGMALVAKTVSLEEEVPEELKSMQSDIHALWLIPDANVANKRTAKGKETLKYINKFTLENKIALIGFAPDHVKKGALASVTVDYKDMGRQAADIAGQILIGGSPSTIPIETAKPFLYLNLNTAGVLGVEIPPNVIQEAKSVIKN